MSIADSPCPINGEAAATTASAPDTLFSESAKSIRGRDWSCKTGSESSMVLCSRDRSCIIDQEKSAPNCTYHRPEKEDSEFADEPLEYPIVKAELDKGHEKDNCLNGMKSAIFLERRPKPWDSLEGY